MCRGSHSTGDDLCVVGVQRLSPACRQQDVEHGAGSQGFGKARCDSRRIGVDRKIQKVEGVEVAVPTVTESALVIYGNRQIPIVLKGITDDYDRLTNLKKLIKPDGGFC